jgi:hypothetical protein
MEHISPLLAHLIFVSFLSKSLLSMSEHEKKRYEHGKNVQMRISVFRREITAAKDKEALLFYKSVISKVNEQVKAKQAEIGDCALNQFIAYLLFSGYPEGILDRSDVYKTILDLYNYIKSVSEGLREVALNRLDLSDRLDAYRKLLDAFDTVIISDILELLGKTKEQLVRDLNERQQKRHFTLSQFSSDLLHPHMFDFKTLQVFAAINQAMTEKDVSKLSSDFEIWMNYLLEILGTSTVQPSRKIEFIIQFVPKLVNFLEKTTVWRTSDLIYHHFLQIVFPNIAFFAKLGSIEKTDYNEVLKKFPRSGFPPTLGELSAFFESNLLVKFRELKSQ